MSITLHNDTAVTDITTGAELKTAKLVNNQQEAEGQMALNLIESANLTAVVSPVGNSGHNINIKV